MTKLREIDPFFMTGTTASSRKVDDLLDIIKVNNTFKPADLDREVINIQSVEVVKKNKKSANRKMAKFSKRGSEIEGPGMTFDNSIFVHFDGTRKIVSVFEDEKPTGVKLLSLRAENERNVSGNKIKVRKQYAPSEITKAYVTNEIITYTDDHDDNP